jgi:hypothetical protein
MGGKSKVAFIDLITAKVIDNPIELKADCQSVWMLEMGKGLFKAKDELVTKPVLLFGGFQSGNILRVPLSRTFEKYSKTALSKEGRINCYDSLFLEIQDFKISQLTQENYQLKQVFYILV